LRGRDGPHGHRPRRPDPRRPRLHPRLSGRDVAAQRARIRGHGRNRNRMISFETPPEIEKRLEFVRGVASQKMRPQARHYDEHEHDVPWDFVDMMWARALKTGQSVRSGTRRPGCAPTIASTTLV